MKKLLLFLVFSFSMLFGAVNINTASKEELMTLKGIGEGKAKAIIEYREKNKFDKPEDIKNVFSHLKWDGFVYKMGIFNFKRLSLAAKFPILNAKKDFKFYD
ncbi:ComEA family DNA-binding protein [Campylobacter corcagiensis]|uniref:Helix-hairpin-helix domain-containing protein n=2 Tax=Campylobacter corcagiensis TaxID=1448857 RepID=A0A7M1LFS6_9BACT|nr:helix-hairpin-helix domain-containing protein [Campylobacter corcagiensis]QKF64545.1 competence protein, ComEA family [Campylobacter corcagiensis]QOQ87280.1 helix-hairpin-helix domain-containing protein [Campylobacter corcagiensis]